MESEASYKISSLIKTLFVESLTSNVSVIKTKPKELLEKHVKKIRDTIRNLLFKYNLLMLFLCIKYLKCLSSQT